MVQNRAHRLVEVDLDPAKGTLIVPVIHFESHQASGAFTSSVPLPRPLFLLEPLSEMHLDSKIKIIPLSET